MSSTARGHSGAGRRAGRQSGSAGFTLAETLVALAVAAVMAAMLTRFVAGTRANAARLAELTDMAVLGETLLARIAPPQELLPGRTEGRQAGFAWRIEIAPASFTARAIQVKEKNARLDPVEAAADRPPLAGGWAAYRVLLTVEAPSGRSHAIDTIRLGRARR